MSYAIAFDLESTGLLKPDGEVQPGIVEFGVCIAVVEDGAIKQESFRTDQIFINPEVFFEEEAKTITGITDEDLKGAPTLLEAFPNIINWFLGVRHLISFNGDAFDIKLLNLTLMRYGLATRFPWPPYQHDLMKIAHDVLNLQGKTGNKYPKLSELHKHLMGEEHSGQHRAGSDAEATMRCAKALCDDGLLYLP